MFSWPTGRYKYSPSLTSSCIVAHIQESIVSTYTAANTMSSKLLSIAELFGVAAYACDGPTYQHHKRADGDIGMLDPPNH